MWLAVFDSWFWTQLMFQLCVSITQCVFGRMCGVWVCGCVCVCGGGGAECVCVCTCVCVCMHETKYCLNKSSFFSPPIDSLFSEDFNKSFLFFFFCIIIRRKWPVYSWYPYLLLISCTLQMANLEERLERLENAIGQNVEKVVSMLLPVCAKVVSMF